MESLKAMKLKATRPTDSLTKMFRFIPAVVEWFTSLTSEPVLTCISHKGNASLQINDSVSVPLPNQAQIHRSKAAVIRQKICPMAGVRAQLCRALSGHLKL